jgi:hypothetical protein
VDSTGVVTLAMVIMGMTSTMSGADRLAIG